MNSGTDHYASPQSSRRPLDTAEGILVALRPCTVDEAFREIVDASRQYRIPVFTLATALIAAAASGLDDADPVAREVVQTKWGGLFRPVHRGHR